MDRGDAAYADGNFSGALAWYQEAEEKGEHGDDFDTRLLNARLATATEKGRQLYLEGHLEKSLELFRAALSWRPEDDRVRHWVLKVRRDLAKSLVKDARELAAESEFEAAEVVLLRAEELWPGDPDVIESLREVRELAAWDKAKAQRYYDQGNQDLNANEIRVARWHFERTREFDENHEGAERRLLQLAQPTLESRMEEVRELIEVQSWHAAVACLRFLLERHPGYDVAETLLEEMKREADAADLLESARRDRSKSNFTEARRSLERGRLLSTQQEAAFAEEERKLLSYELLATYLEGRKFQFEGRYENAVGRFFDVVDRVQSDPELLATTKVEEIPREKRYLLDEAFDPQELLRKPEIWFTYARAQRSLMDLRQRLSLAPAVYDEARRLEQEGQLVEARGLYRDLMIDLPSYRDTFERLRAVEVQLGIASDLVPALPDQGRVPKEVLEEGVTEELGSEGG